MFRILEATRGLCLPLPPGYHTLLAVLAVRCLPHQTFLQYIDHGFLQLTETFLSRLMTGTHTHTPETHSQTHTLLSLSLRMFPMEQRIYHMWDHPVSSASISRDYVRTLLEKHTASHSNCSASVPALNPFEETENVDARFVEETALKQTLILLGFDTK
uniref:Gamma-secretase-activating protein C-terminal domain-containing protein n=1 Tax=Seriola lalandi dorsalis TaxID=1841481 RepID=A0A3B4XFW3_SERLL